MVAASACGSLLVTGNSVAVGYSCSSNESQLIFIIQKLPPPPLLAKIGRRQWEDTADFNTAFLCIPEGNRAKEALVFVLS